jgi:pSer/pThr/pTyr-binding forkhead associated (FHA) protein
MPESVLTLLKLCLVAVIYLFFFRVLRAVWFEMKAPTAPAPAPPPPVATRAPARPAAQPARASGGPARRLTVRAPEGLAGITFDLDGAEMTVGRAQGCAVLLGDPTVSSIHARIAARGEDRVIEDLDSRNGTFVNKARISAPTPLKAGDRVGIGPVVVLEAG